MAGKSCWINTLARIALACCAVMTTLAQTPVATPTGSLTGRLTDLHSHPVAGAVLIAHNEITGEESKIVTDKSGFFNFGSLFEGTYTLLAESPQLGQGRLEGIVVTAGRDQRLLTAMEFSFIPEQEQAERAMAELHKLNARHAIALPSLLSAHTIPEIMLQELYLVGRWIPPTETPRTTTITLAEPLSRIPLAELSLQTFNQPLPRWKIPLVEVLQLADLPLQTLEMVSPANSLQVVQDKISPTTELAVNAASPSTKENPQSSDPVAAAVTTQWTGEELRALPAAGRRWQDFVLDTPTSASAPGGQGESTLRSSEQTAASTSLDGVIIASATTQSPSQNEEGGSMGKPWAGGRSAVVGEAAIHAVQVEASNVQATQSRASAGEVNVETERGSNSWHGQGFLFSKQNLWGAQNPFTQLIAETAPATSTTIPTFTSLPYTPPDRETTWGFGVGHSLRRDKLFAFAALDNYSRNDPGVATVRHPNLFFAQPTDAQLLAVSVRLGPSSDPLAAGVKAYSCVLEIIAGTGVDCPPGWPLASAMLGPASRSAKQFVGFARFDWQASERQHGTLEGIGAHWNAPGGGLTRAVETFGTHSFGSSQASEETVLVRWESFLTSNLLVVTQASAGRQILAAHAETPSVFEHSLLSDNAWGQLPQIVVDSRYGFNLGNPSRFGPGSYPDEHHYQLQEQVDWVHGAMLLKVGIDLNHDADAISLLRNQTGTYTYKDATNFASDLWAFETGAGSLNIFHPHNCDQTGTGFGNLPCYSYYSQTLGPTNWSLSSNDWAGYATAQWQATKSLVLSAGLRWDREQFPPPISRLANVDLPLTEKLPSPGNQWGPRFSLALGKTENRWPLLRLGYGMYFGRTENATLETVLTQTGSLAGDLNVFMRPTDDCQNCAGGAPPFPYVLRGTPGTVETPGAIELSPSYRNPEIHQALAAVEETLPGHVQVTVSALASLGRRLPVSIDTNFDPAVNPSTITYAVVDGSGLGPIKTPQITVPFYASWPASACPGSAALNGAGECGRLNPNYQQIDEIFSRANSTYEAAVLKVERYTGKGLSLHAHYTYAHAMDWNPSEGMQVAGGSVFDPTHFNQEYGTSNLDVRHSAAVMAVWLAPWKLRQNVGRLANGWMLSGIGQYRSGLPYTMRTTGSLAEEFDTATGAAIVGLAPGMNGSGGDNRVYGVGRNTYRYPATWKADLRLGRRFELGGMRELQLLAESFNLFNHQNVTQVETSGYYLESGSTSGALPTFNFMTGLKANTTAFGQPLNINATDFFRQRQFQFGLRVKF